MTIHVDLHEFGLDRDEDPQALAPDEQARAARFLADRDRRRFVAGRTRLRAILAEYVATPIVFSYGPAGKPAVAGVAFNLAHSGDRALVAVTRAPVRIGVDLELIRHIEQPKLLAQKVFSSAELAWLAGAPGDFFRIWARKEAYLKGCGDGLTGAPERITVTPEPSAAGWQIIDLPRPVSALAVESSDGVELHVR